MSLAMTTETSGKTDTDPAVGAAAEPTFMLCAALWEQGLPRGWLVRTMSEAVAQLGAIDQDSTGWWRKVVTGSFLHLA